MSEIREWLAEYKILHADELSNYSAKLRKNENLVNSLFEFLGTAIQQELDPVCHQLFEFYRSEEASLQRFTCDFIPCLLYQYMKNVNVQAHQNYSGLETCLLGIFNLNRESKPAFLTIPTLAKPSIYHEPSFLGTLILTESALSDHKGEPRVLASGSSPQVERITSQNRYCILTAVLKTYNADICNLSPRSHEALCSLGSSISRDGFKGGRTPDGVRIMIDGQFMVELLHGIYYVMFNSHSRLGMQAIEDIHTRANYDMLPDVLLVTNAIRNSMEYKPGEENGPMGISIALSTTCTQEAITNATFKTDKLPDDICIPEEDSVVTDQFKQANERPDKTVSLTNRITKQFSKKLEKSFKPKKDGIVKKYEDSAGYVTKQGKDVIEMNSIETNDYLDGERTVDGAGSVGVMNGDSVSVSDTKTSDTSDIQVILS